jgi:outer membrane immunogenic protein
MNNTLSKTLMTGVAGTALLAAAPVMAADLAVKAPRVAPVAPPVPVFSWTGCFVGAHVGWGWGRKDFNVFSTSFSPAPSLNGNVDTSGPIFGGQLGCDWQFGAGKGPGAGAWVIGIQGSVSGADINGFGPPASCFGSSLKTKTDFLASVTGRLGWAGWDPRVLFYVRGGVAWAHERDDVTPQSSHFFGQETATGWTVGVGTEWAFAPSWSAFVEWDHYGFGRKRVDLFEAGSGSTFLHADVKQHIETVRIGVNYRFNWLLGKGKAPVVARY